MGLRRLMDQVPRPLEDKDLVSMKINVGFRVGIAASGIGFGGCWIKLRKN